MDTRITLKEAAEQFGVSVERLRKAAQRGGLPADQVGAGPHGIWLVYAEDVADYLKSRSRNTEEQP